jgi:hypothetical protein
MVGKEVDRSNEGSSACSSSVLNTLFALCVLEPESRVAPFANPRGRIYHAEGLDLSKQRNSGKMARLNFGWVLSSGAEIQERQRYRKDGLKMEYTRGERIQGN